jgi:wobble nucleotide-excising tRNase
MIKSISLREIATYENENIDKLKKINFFYGANGSGKTTISKVIARPDDFQDCNIVWENTLKMKTIVFNEDFIRENFYEKDSLEGVYTLGEDAKDIEQEIEEKNRKLEELKRSLGGLRDTKKEKEEERSELWDKFKNCCWEKAYQNYKDVFDIFFTGYKNSKENLARKIFDESCNGPTLTIDELKNKYDMLYEEGNNSLSELGVISEEQIKMLREIESNDIIKIPIIGKGDFEIAKMIEKLQNYDWIWQGKEYYNKNYNESKQTYNCPFCGRETSDDFRKQLELYFNESYNDQINQLDTIESKYKEITGEILATLNNINDIANNKFLDEMKQKLKEKVSLLSSKIYVNRNILSDKKKNPSNSYTLEAIITEIEEVNNLLNSVNKRIKEYNLLIADKEREKENLSAEIWAFIRDKLKDDVATYKKEAENIGKALSNIEDGISKNQKDSSQIENEISELEKQIKSVKPTINAINTILDSFGFKGFHLTTSEDNKYYQIVRADGSLAKDTLSEGERSFLVFLYFYYLIQGAKDINENVSENEVVVFDDPVSSLDSDVLFIVSTLIKDILNKLRNKESNIKQVFLLTHNTYFFREVTYSSRNSEKYREDTAYYIVKKTNNYSHVEYSDTNPIKTSYELLWDNIKRNNVDNVSIQNSMRRIIEYYFNFLANIDTESLINKFEGSEKLVCRSLIHWVDTGSHSVFDEIDFSQSNEDINKYRDVFKRIFELTGQLSHFNMMMGIHGEDKLNSA